MTTKINLDHWKDLLAQVQEGKKKKLDPVDQDELKGKHDDRDDKDIDNDGDVDKSDEYLHKRRKATSKAIRKGKGEKETEVMADEAVSKAGLRKKLAKASASSEKGKKAVTLPKAPWDKEKTKKESTQWPIYQRILEKRDEHYKGATEPQKADDNYSQGAKDFVDDHGDRKPEDVVDIEKVVKMNQDEVVKHLPNKSATRPNDQKKGQPSADGSEGKDKL